MLLKIVYQLIRIPVFQKLMLEVHLARVRLVDLKNTDSQLYYFSIWVLKKRFAIKC